jgi:hypothetical protein
LVLGWLRINGDGRPDLITANGGSSSVSVLLGKGDDTFSPSTPLTGLGLSATPLLADLDGDHIPDSVVLDRSGRILFRRGLGPAGSFAPPVVLNPELDSQTGQLLRPARDLALVDTGSGWAVAAADAGPDPLLSKQAGHPVYTISLYTYDPSTGKFKRTTAFATDFLPERIAAANLNGNADGLDDLIVANGLDNSVAVAFQVAPGQFGTPLTGSLQGSRGPSLVVPVGVAPPTSPSSSALTRTASSASTLPSPTRPAAMSPCSSITPRTHLPAPAASAPAPTPPRLPVPPQPPSWTPSPSRWPWLPAPSPGPGTPTW